jgi:hypothetical protein
VDSSGQLMVDLFDDKICATTIREAVASCQQKKYQTDLELFTLAT